VRYGRSGVRSRRLRTNVSETRAVKRSWTSPSAERAVWISRECNNRTKRKRYRSTVENRKYYFPRLFLPSPYVATESGRPTRTTTSNHENRDRRTRRDDDDGHHRMIYARARVYTRDGNGRVARRPTVTSRFRSWFFGAHRPAADTRRHARRTLTIIMFYARADAVYVRRCGGGRKTSFERTSETLRRPAGTGRDGGAARARRRLRRPASVR